MTPFEMQYLAQERCKELRGESYKPVVYFNIDLRPALARILRRMASSLEAKPGLDKRARV